MAIHRLTQLTVGVPDPEAAIGFYEAFGLSNLGQGRFATRDGGEQLRLVPARWRGVQRIGVGCDDPDDLERISAAAERAGHSATRHAAPTPSLEVADPASGVVFEVSDSLDGVIAFTRCSESHHNLAVQQAPCRLLHHMAFEVDDVDEVARGGSALTAADAGRHVWGLGRHAIGSNWFWYLRDPAGNYVEYTADLDRITSSEDYRPKDWQGQEWLYAYGPPVPPVFLEPDDVADLLAAQAAGEDTPTTR